MYHVWDEYELLVHTYYEKLYRFIYGYCKNSSDAEDVVQVAYLRLLEADKKFESEQHVKNWLYQVAVNYAKDLMKSRWHKREKCRMICLGSRKRSWIYLRQSANYLTNTVLLYCFTIMRSIRYGK